MQKYTKASSLFIKLINGQDMLKFKIIYYLCKSQGVGIVDRSRFINYHLREFNRYTSFNT